MPENRQVRRQARGERRMAEILDAAAVVLGDVGYEAATTNSIAAQAGISPGSLYQFFASKEAIAKALAQRFVGQMSHAHASAFDLTDVANLSLDELIDRAVDPVVAFNVANPGLKALFARTDMPDKLTAAIRPIQEAVFARIEAVISARSPNLPSTQQARCALVCLQIVKALIPPITTARGKERAALVAELKNVLRGYLGPVMERAKSAAS